MASRPEPTTSTTSCWQCETNAARVVPTLLWSSAINIRIRYLEKFSCQERMFIAAIHDRRCRARGDAAISCPSGYDGATSTMIDPQSAFQRDVFTSGRGHSYFAQTPG